MVYTYMCYDMWSQCSRTVLRMRHGFSSMSQRVVSVFITAITNFAMWKSYGLTLHSFHSFHKHLDSFRCIIMYKKYMRLMIWPKNHQLFDRLLKFSKTFFYNSTPLSGDYGYSYPSLVPLDSETHGGEDVAVYALGPWQHLFTSSYEQNAIPHLMAYAMCLGEDHHINCRVRNHRTGFWTNSAVNFKPLVSVISICIVIISLCSF